MQQRPLAAQASEPEPSADFWQADADTAVVTVDDADSLRDAATLLRAACAVGIDCEWQPGSSRPSATLLQLAVRTDAARCVVLILVRCRAASLQQMALWYDSRGRQLAGSFLLCLTAAQTPAQDMLALPAEEVGAVLQSFLRDERTLKVSDNKLMFCDGLHHRRY